MKLLITGCPHSGTLFTAEVLRAAGLTCGHEAIYTLWGRDPNPRAAGRVDAEVAWEAVFYLGTPDIPAGTMIVHQVRDPIDWINSWVRSFYSGPAWREGPAWKFLSEIYPDICSQRDQDPVRAAMSLWVDMNRRCEQHATSRHHVEDLRGDLGAAILGDLCRDAGLAVEQDVLKDVLAVSNRNSNHHEGPTNYVALSWEALPRGDDLDNFRSLARTYAYGD